MRQMDLSDAFALVLQKHRKRKGFSREALAQRAGLHQTYIGLLERKLRNPSLDTASLLAKALGVSLSELVAESEALRKRTGKEERT